MATATYLIAIIIIIVLICYFYFTRQPKTPDIQIVARVINDMRTGGTYTTAKTPGLSRDTYDRVRLAASITVDKYMISKCGSRDNALAQLENIIQDGPTAYASRADSVYQTKNGVDQLLSVVNKLIQIASGAAYKTTDEIIAAIYPSATAEITAIPVSDSTSSADSATNTTMA